jgi:hypothetical protein
MEMKWKCQRARFFTPPGRLSDLFGVASHVRWFGDSACPLGGQWHLAWEPPIRAFLPLKATAYHEFVTSGGYEDLGTIGADLGGLPIHDIVACARGRPQIVREARGGG